MTLQKNFITGFLYNKYLTILSCYDKTITPSDEVQFSVKKGRN
jgi:hypothetical protein